MAGDYSLKERLLFTPYFSDGNNCSVLFSISSAIKAPSISLLLKFLFYVLITFLIPILA